MNNETHSQPPVAARPSIRRKSAKPKQDKATIIEVPRPPASALNKERPVSDLIKAQLKHVHHAEKSRQHPRRRSGVDPHAVRTEAEAAAYIAQITRLLHPVRRKRKKREPEKSA